MSQEKKGVKKKLKNIPDDDQHLEDWEVFEAKFPYLQTEDWRNAHI